METELDTIRARFTRVHGKYHPVPSVPAMEWAGHLQDGDEVRKAEIVWNMTNQPKSDPQEN